MRELLLAKAIELAVDRTAFVNALAEREGRAVEFYDNAVLTEVYYPMVCPSAGSRGAAAWGTSCTLVTER